MTGRLCSGRQVMTTSDVLKIGLVAHGYNLRRLRQGNHHDFKSSLGCRLSSQSVWIG